MTAVACYGSEGSFSHIAALQYFGDSTAIIGTARFTDIFSLVASGKAAFGILPIENSLAGSIHENFDNLTRSDTKIVGEHLVRIEHALVALHVASQSAQARLGNITKVISHQKALEQCLNFFSDHPWMERAVFGDTAGAARHVASSGDTSLAAIASREAASLYGLEVLRHSIEDDPKNYTRFVVIAKEMGELDQCDKCSVSFRVPHSPGTLLKVLQLLAQDDANLTKLESRPVHGKPFEYLFYLDFHFGKSREEILGQLRTVTYDLKLLGRYRAASIPT